MDESTLRDTHHVDLHTLGYAFRRTKIINLKDCDTEFILQN